MEIILFLINIRQMATSLYLFLMYLIPVVIGMATLSASAYGLGKHENDTQSIEYKVSLVFFIIGLVLTTCTVTLWVAGNYSVDLYKPIVIAKQKVTEIGGKTIEELDTCRKKILDMETISKKKLLDEASS